MKNLIGILLISLAFLVLTGCAAPPERVIVEVECEIEENGECTGRVGVEWGLPKTGGKSSVIKSLAGFDASLAELDFSSSSSGVNITTSSGNAVIKLTTDTGQLFTSVFSWSKVGDSIIADNPFAVEAWLNNHIAQVAAIEIDYGSIQVTGAAGANTIVGEAVYGGQVQAGDAHGWYEDTSPGGGGITPPPDTID